MLVAMGEGIAEIPKGRAMWSAWYQLPIRTRWRLTTRFLAGRCDADVALAPLLIGVARLNAKIWWTPAAFMTIWVLVFSVLAARNPALAWTVSLVLVVFALTLAAGLFIRYSAKRCEESCWETLNRKSP
jgi:hypothetical protein